MSAGVPVSLANYQISLCFSFLSLRFFLLFLCFETWSKTICPKRLTKRWRKVAGRIFFLRPVLKLILEKFAGNGWILQPEGALRVTSWECRWSKFTAGRVNDTGALLHTVTFTGRLLLWVPWTTRRLEVTAAYLCSDFSVYNGPFTLVIVSHASHSLAMLCRIRCPLTIHCSSSFVLYIR